MSFQDKAIVCSDCGVTFTFSPPAARHGRRKPVVVTAATVTVATVALARCIRPRARIAARLPRSPSSPATASPSTARTATGKSRLDSPDTRFQIYLGVGFPASR